MEHGTAGLADRLAALAFDLAPHDSDAYENLLLAAQLLRRGNPVDAYCAIAGLAKSLHLPWGKDLIAAVQKLEDELEAFEETQAVAS